MFLRYFYLLSFLFSGITFSNCQEILISKDINIRNYFSYDIVGKVNDRIVLYRDQGIIKEVDIFDLSMKHKLNTELLLEDKKALIHALVNQDTLFQVIYSYTQKDSVVTALRAFDHRMVLRDSVTLYKKEKNDIKSRFKNLVSEDKSKMVIHYADKERNLDVQYIDLHTKKLRFNKKYTINKVDVISDMIIGELSNDGELFFVFDQNHANYKKDKHKMKLMVARGSVATISDLTFDQNLIKDMILAVDNKNNRIQLAGLYNEKGDQKIDGLYFFNQEINKLSPTEEVRFLPFTNNFVNDIASKRKNNQKQLENFNLNNLIFRNDGGVLLFAEMNKTYNRRNPYNGVFQNTQDRYGRRGWTDYYNEDVIVMAFNKSQEMEWKTVLYKKQFSQDDDGVYSSYFIFKSPSRLKLLYNDEIKRNNTVSEYMIDPLGNKIRNSLLSTDYQKLKLRFKGAIQVSSRAMIVPSESSYMMNLVKIEY